MSRETQQGGRLEHVESRLEIDGRGWRVQSFVLDEGMNRPFRAELCIVCDASVAVAPLTDAAAVFTFGRGAAMRTLRGEITRAEARLDVDGLLATVRFEPALARLDDGPRSRIFQGRTTLEIVREVLAGAAELASMGDELAPAVARDYCVQYRESDLAFLSRLLEQDGIAWFLDDDGASPVLRLVADGRSFPRLLAEGDELPVLAEHFDEADRETVQALTIAHGGEVPSVIERDWEWLASPSRVVESRHPPEASGRWIEQHHPRRGAATSAEVSARRGYERLAGRRGCGRGRSNVGLLAVGARVAIVGAGGDAVEVVVTGVQHRGNGAASRDSGGNAAAGPNYTNTFECQLLDHPFRPELRIPAPRVEGLQTAVVVGPPGEEIHTDEHGRVRVRMHWDRASNPDEDASCWLRVAQGWAGHGWGSLFLPRVGMEVLVAFLDGDPDRPVCVGALYNGSNRPPQTLPADRTKSTLRTQSTPGGAGYNEVTFDDAAGAEQVYVRAQRDLEAHVLADLDVRVGAQERRRVGGGRRTEVGAGDELRVGGDRVTCVEGGQTDRVAGSVALTVQGQAPVDGLGVGATGMSVAIVQGGYRLSAPERIELVCGASTIVMTPTGISMNSATSLNLVCGGALVALAPATLSVLAPLLAIASSGAQLGLGRDASLRSGGGVRLGCGDECELSLDGSVSLTGREIVIDAGTEVAMSGSRVQVTGRTQAAMSSDGVVVLKDAGGTVEVRDGVVQLNDCVRRVDG